MPFVLLFIGIVAIAIGVRGHGADAGKLLASEFTGPNSFIQWFLAIMILGLVGYYKPARPVTDAMLGLVILAMILSKKGLFAKLEDAFQHAQAIPGNYGNGDPIASNNPADIAKTIPGGISNPWLQPGAPNYGAMLTDPNTSAISPYDAAVGHI